MASAIGNNYRAQYSGQQVSKGKPDWMLVAGIAMSIVILIFAIVAIYNAAKRNQVKENCIGRQATVPGCASALLKTGIDSGKSIVSVVQSCVPPTSWGCVAAVTAGFANEFKPQI